MNRNVLPKERIIFDNYNRNFKEWLEEIDNKEDYSDRTLTEMFYDDERFEWETEMDNINSFDKNIKGKYIIFGSIGRWNGCHSGWQVFDSLEKAIDWAITDCDYIKLYDENGQFNIHCSHHDGSCSFGIKELTDKGEQYLDNWEYNWNDKRNSKYIGEQLLKRYSRNLNFAHKVYGCKQREYEPITKVGLINQLNNQARSFYC